MSTASIIAANLEAAFARSGFAEPGVAALREASGVTLRTLYRHFPSRDAMVVGALRARHGRYLERIGWVPEGIEGSEAVLSLFGRVADWMGSEASTVCLFAQALAAHPGSDAIREEVVRYRGAVRDVIGDRLALMLPHLAADDRERVGDALFVLHEGQVQASGEIGVERAHAAARSTGAALLRALRH